MTANIGSMTGKSREIADIMHRRKIKIACIQETKWKGKEIGEGFKLYYHCICRARNGIWIILSKEWQDKILEIKRISDRLMTMKLVSGNTMLNIISVYAPQVGCSQQDKYQFYENLESEMRRIPLHEELIIGGDLNGVHAMPRKRPNYLHSGKRSEDSENVQVSGLNVRCQRRSRERCKQQNKDAWSKWMETTGVMCDRNIPTKLKDKVYKTAIKPAMVYGAECWAVRKKEERKLHTTEMRMLRWARGKTRLDHVRNVDIWKEAHMYPMAEFLREKRLRWFGCVQRRDKDDATRQILQMTVDGKRNRGRPNMRWRDLVKDDMARNQMTTEMAEDRRHWHVMIRAGTLRSVEADRWEGEQMGLVKSGLNVGWLYYRGFFSLWNTVWDWARVTVVVRWPY